MICLSDKHRELAEDNHNLIYGFLHKYCLDVDDWYDTIAIGYCKGIATFNPDKGLALSTYLYKCMYNAYLADLRKAYACSRKSDDLLSLDDTVYDDSNYSNYDIIADSYDLEGELVEKIYFDQWKSSLKDRESLILHYTLLGYTQREIGKLLNLTQSYICRIVKKLRANYKKEH